MIPAAFTYHRPRTVDTALRLLTDHGADAKVLAGGQSLLALMKLRLATPGHVIDIGRIAALRRIRVRAGRLHVGALATHWMVESTPAVRRAAPGLAETAAAIGDLQVRNLGTVGGSLAHADPAADYPAMVLALDAEFALQGRDGARTVPASEFFRGVMTTALRPGELLVEVVVPVASTRFGAAYLKMPNPASGFALAGVAAAVGLDSDGLAAHVRVGITGVAPTAYRATAVEEAVVGQDPTDERLAQASGAAADGVEANSDIHAGAAYRLHLARVLTRRALILARDRARGGRSRRTSAGGRAGYGGPRS
ncbi:MAG: FAD binding domain-containing protein [bacterium]